MQEQAEKRSRLNVLEQLQAEHEGFSAGTLAALKQAAQVLGSLADKIRVPDRYVPAIETALGHHLQIVLTEQPDSAQRILGDLDAHKKGRASIAALEWNRRADRSDSTCPAYYGGVILRAMSRENVEVVSRAYEAWNRRDFDEAAELLAPDIEWQMPPNLPDVETWRSSDEVTRGLEAFLESWTELRVEVRELIDVRRQLHEFPQPVNGKFHVWGAHAPSRAPFGASPNGREYEKRFSVGAPKTAREARALPR